VKRAPVIALAALVAILSASWVTADEDETQDQKPIGGLTFKEEFELTVVNIDVFVRDKKGNAITELTVDDFTVYQNGKERKVSNFALYTEEVFSSMPAEPAPGLEPATPAEEPLDAVERPVIEPVHLVVYIDNENLRPFDRTRVLAQVRSFLREFINPYSFVMVVSYQRSLKILQPFTQDSSAVLDAIRSQRKVYAARPDREAERNSLFKDMQRLRTDRQSGSQGGTYQSMRMSTYEEMRTFADETSHDLRLSLDAMRQVTMMLSGLLGRNSSIHVSSGLPMVAGKDLFHEYQSTFQDGTHLLSPKEKYRQRGE